MQLDSTNQRKKPFEAITALIDMNFCPHEVQCAEIFITRFLAGVYFTRIEGQDDDLSRRYLEIHITITTTPL